MIPTDSTPLDAMSFWGYDVGKVVVQKLSPSTCPSEFSMAQFFAAGLFSAVPMTLVSAPFERVKILLQTQAQHSPGSKHHKKPLSGVSILQGLYRTGGMRSVYRGNLMTFARDAPDSAAYFATYEYCKWRFSAQQDGVDSSLSLLAVGGAGASAGFVMLIPLFPIDTVKSRLQAVEGRQTIREVVRYLYGRRGVRAFFPGLLPALLRSLPANAAATLAWESMRLALGSF